MCAGWLVELDDNTVSHMLRYVDHSTQTVVSRGLAVQRFETRVLLNVYIRPSGAHVDPTVCIRTAEGSQMCGNHTTTAGTIS